MTAAKPEAMRASIDSFDKTTMTVVKAIGGGSALE